MIAVAEIAAALLLLALLPVGVRFACDAAGTRLAAYLGPITVQLLPVKPKKSKKTAKKTPKKAKPAAKTAEKAKPKPKLDLRQLPPLLRPVFSLVCDALGDFRRHLRVDLLRLHIRYGADNPADAAIRCGEAWAVIGCAMPLLQTAFTIRRQDVQAIYEDGGAGLRADAEVRVRLLLFELVGFGAKYGIRAGKLALPLLKNKTKAVQKT